jgi:hypothetical protein
MEFFIRRYVKGKKNSGTSDIYTSEHMIGREEFEDISNTFGAGKYLLCVRGKGIRGFRKVDEYFVEENLIFAADDVIGVKQEIKLAEMSSDDLLDIMGSMIKNAPSDGLNNSKFMSDLSRFHAELATRKGVQESENYIPESFEAPINQPLVSAGFPIGTTVTSFALGAFTGGIVVYLMNKSAMDDLKSQIQTLESSVKSAEESINSLKKKADSIQQKGPLSMDQMFLSSYNGRNGLSGL